MFIHTNWSQVGNEPTTFVLVGRVAINGATRPIKYIMLTLANNSQLQESSRELRYIAM